MSEVSGLVKFLTSLPNCSYRNESKFKVEFKQYQTPEISLEQLCKGDSRMWKEPCLEKVECTSYKQIVVCAWSAVFFNSLFSAITRILYWQGDPYRLGEQYDKDKFTPAVAKDVQELLESTQPECKFWVIDEKIWMELQLEFLKRYEGDTYYSFHADSLNFPRKEIDLSFYRFWMTDDLFTKISPGFSPMTTQIELQSCQDLNPQTIVMVLQKHSQLQFLGLRETKPWGVVELKALAHACPYLESLEICIDTTAPLNILAQFRYLKHLYLDLSKNLQVKNLSFLSDFGNSVIFLKLSGCTNLTDLRGLQDCHNLEAIWFEDINISHFDDLIVQLGHLKKLKLLALHQCQYTLSGSKQVNLIKKWLPNVAISVAKKGIYRIPEGKELSVDALVPHKESTQPTRMRCETLTCTPTSSNPGKKQHSVSQIFWDGEGKWPDHRLDRLSILNRIEIKDDGHIVFAAPSIEQRQLEICSDVKIVPYEKIDVALLRTYQTEHKGAESLRNYYAGQLEITVATDNLTPIPSRGVFNIPVACSENLLWVRSTVTGELFVRLSEQKAQRRTQQLLLRYAFAADTITDQRHMQDQQQLPDIIQSAFKKLSQNKKILAHFPHFQQLITDMPQTPDRRTRYKRIQQYCQMNLPSGFTDAPLDAKTSSIVHAFINFLAIDNANTAADLLAIFDMLLQQKGVCEDIARCAKLLCGCYDIPAHIGISKTHAFMEHAYDQDSQLITATSDLGGGTAQVTCHPLLHLQAEAKTNQYPEEKSIPDLETQYQLASESHKERSIRHALAEFKPMPPLGTKCRNLIEYMQLLLSCRNPLIYFDNPDDADKIVAALRQYADHLFYISHPEQIASLWDGLHIADHKPHPAPGWLQHFLKGKDPKVLAMNFAEFDRYNLASVQGIGDQHRTLNGLPVNDTAVIGLAPKTLAHEEIFLSRFTPVIFRADLLANIKPVRAVTPLPADEKISAPMTHLDDNPYRAQDSVSTVALDGDRLNCVLGPLGQAIENKQEVVLTGIPKEFDQWLSLAALTGEIPINAELRKFPSIPIFSHKRPPPDLKNIRFVRKEEMKAAHSHYYLNHHSYSRLVSKGQRTDPETGLSYPRQPVLLTEELPEVIIFTRSISYADWCGLVDVVNQRGKPVSLYLCPGVKIAGTPYVGAEKKHQPVEMKSLRHCRVIESDNPEQILTEMLAKQEVSGENVLTLTEDVGLELLEMINRKGERILLNYRQGWLLSRFFSGKTTVLMGDQMSAKLWDALESWFSVLPHAYTNDGRKEFTGLQDLGRVVMLKSRNPSQPLASTVVCHSDRRASKASLPKQEKKAEKTTDAQLSYRERAERVTAFLEDTRPESIFFELFGPPGSGKTTSVAKAVKTLHGKDRAVEHFLSVEDYVTWRDAHREDQKTLCVLQLDDCRRSPPGQLEYLRDLTRNRQFYWKDHWYPAPKILMTNNPDSDPKHQKHPLFKALQIPSLHFPALTREELAEYVLQPLLEEIKAVNGQTHALNELILWAYQYIGKTLPYESISARQLTTICQRLSVLLSQPTEEKSLQVCACACYEEFFGLFPQKNQRQVFWNELCRQAGVTVTEELNPIAVDEKLKTGVEKQGLQLTAQSVEVMSMIQRMVQMHNQHGEQKDFPGQCRILLEGPPGILKTELTIATLEALRFTPAPEVPDGKPHYLNLVAGDPYLMEKKLWQAYRQGWIVVCNELNLLKPPTIQLLMKLLEIPKTGFCLVGTQNLTSAGSGREPLPPALKNRLQVVYLQDYSRNELIWFAKNRELIDEAALLADLYLSLRDYQQLHRLPLSNPRHYFRWLEQLQPLKRRERSLSVIMEHLLQVGCNPPLSAQNDTQPNQRHAAEFILTRVPAKNFPKKIIITESNPMTLLPSPAQFPPVSQSPPLRQCLVM